MIKELVHDPIFLAGKSEKATKDDLTVAQDLLDTLVAHREGCVSGILIICIAIVCPMITEIRKLDAK